MLAALLNRNEGWKLRARLTTGAYQTLTASDKIHFNGLTFGSGIFTGEFQESTHISNSGDTHLCTSDHVLNVEYISPTQANVNGSTISLPLVISQCPFILELHFLEEVQTTNTRFFSHGATEDVGLTDSDIKVTYPGASSWASANGSGQFISLADHASDVIHEWPVAISYSPQTGGTATGSIKLTLSFI